MTSLINQSLSEIKLCSG